jgi:hypothetical protein
VKTCFNNAELAHVWLNLTDAELDGGREGRGSSFSFRGRELCSYATAIARIYPRNGRRLVLIDGSSFSNSTSKHQNYLRRALRDSDVNISLDFGRRGQALIFTPKQIWEACIAECQEYATQASKARGRAPYLLGLARSAVVKAESVRVFFGLRNKPFAPDMSKLIEYAKDEAAKRAEIEAAKQKRIAKFMKEEAPRMLTLWRERQEGCIAWDEIKEHGRALGVYSLPMGSLLSTPEFQGTAALRLSEDGSRVETSQGAQVLVRTVKFLWAFCMDAKRNALAVSPDLIARFPRLDNYSVNAIDAGGNLTAGCHHIPFAEVQEIARALKLPPFNGELPQAPSIPAEEVSA